MPRRGPAGTARPRRGLPVRGDVVAGLSVALVLVPQSLAYAELAGLPAVHGLYTAAVATVAAGLIGSSPYLQTGPVALTSLLTFGALAPLADAGTRDFAVHAALLALVVGAVRLLLGLLRWGVVAYLMSQPVVSAFTAAAAILIVASQLPGLLDVRTDESNPLLAAGQALGDPGGWGAVSAVVGLATVALVIGGRRVSPRFPGTLVAIVAALGLSAVGWVSVTEVGDIPERAAAPELGPAVGRDREPARAGRGHRAGRLRRAGEHRPAVRRARTARRGTPTASSSGRGWRTSRPGRSAAIPAGGSFSRSALNRLSGARTRWSGVVTGLAVLAVMPVASVLSGLPRAALAGLVVAAVVTLVDFRPFLEAWRASRPQFLVAVPTFVATLVFAPRVERGVLVGVGLSLAVHLWRELRLELDVWTTHDTLHVRPQGVLYFASAPGLETRVMTLMAEGPDLRHVVVHLDRLGRLDLTGALVLRSLVEDMQRGDADVVIEGTQPQARRLVDAVLGRGVADCRRANRNAGHPRVRRRVARVRRRRGSPVTGGRRGGRRWRHVAAAPARWTGRAPCRLWAQLLEDLVRRLESSAFDAAVPQRARPRDGVRREPPHRPGGAAPASGVRGHHLQPGPADRRPHGEHRAAAGRSLLALPRGRGPRHEAAQRGEGPRRASRHGCGGRPAAARRRGAGLHRAAALCRRRAAGVGPHVDAHGRRAGAFSTPT